MLQDVVDIIITVCNSKGCQILLEGQMSKCIYIRCAFDQQTGSLFDNLQELYGLLFNFLTITIVYRKI